MKPWNQRPREIRNLFNPAFCGLVLVRSIQGYCEKSSRAMPFSLTLLVLPLCLHKDTREIISTYSRSYFTKMIQEHPEIRIGLAQRTQSLLPYTFEAFSLLMSHDAISVDSSGCIAIVDKKIRKSLKGTQETVDCQLVARILGRKFCHVNDRVTIYTSLGIRP